MKTYKNVSIDSIIPLILSGGEFVAIFQGRSESGPRALGNRSIVWDPQLPYGRGLILIELNRESLGDLLLELF